MLKEIILLFGLPNDSVRSDFRPVSTGSSGCADYGWPECEPNRRAKSNSLISHRFDSLPTSCGTCSELNTNELQL
jgi:hypothetical protein